MYVTNNNYYICMDMVVDYFVKISKPSDCILTDMTTIIRSSLAIAICTHTHMHTSERDIAIDGYMKIYI